MPLHLELPSRSKTLVSCIACPAQPGGGRVTVVPPPRFAANLDPVDRAAGLATPRLFWSQNE